MLPALTKKFKVKKKKKPPATQLPFVLIFPTLASPSSPALPRLTLPSGLPVVGLPWQTGAAGAGQRQPVGSALLSSAWLQMLAPHFPAR